MTPLRRDTLVTLAGGGVVLAALTATPWAALGLPWRFPLAAAVLYGLALPLIWLALPERLPGNRFGAANAVTLVRLAATAVLAASAAALSTADLTAPAMAWTLVALAAAALALDGIDGWVARRQRLASPFGARFDMELDAAFMLVLAVLAWRMERAGGWVLAAGLARYAFVAAAMMLPRLRAPLPPSSRRRVACALSAGLLAASLAPPPLPAPGAVLLAGTAVLTLLLSFALDILWLARRRPPALPSSPPLI